MDVTPPAAANVDTMKNYGLYAKPMYSVTTGLALYGLLGYGKSSYEKNAVTYSESGLQWGLGAKYELSNGVGLFVDYMQMYSGSNYDGLIVSDAQFDGMNVGATYTF
jgi:opacity protein-like surface antigen